MGLLGFPGGNGCGDIESNLKEDIMDWKKRIPGCFGSADCRLAGHACDLKRAAELLNECLDLQDGISYHELESALVDYMKSKGAIVSILNGN